MSVPLAVVFRRRQGKRRRSHDRRRRRRHRHGLRQGNRRSRRRSVVPPCAFRRHHPCHCHLVLQRNVRLTSGNPPPHRAYRAASALKACYANESTAINFSSRQPPSTLYPLPIGAAGHKLAHLAPMIARRRRCTVGAISVRGSLAEACCHVVVLPAQHVFPPRCTGPTNGTVQPL